MYFVADSFSHKKIMEKQSFIPLIYQYSVGNSSVKYFIW